MSKYKDKQDGKELDLSLCNLTTVSVRDVSLLPKATSLNLSYNKLACLPSNFPTLTHIIRLDLSNNSLTDLPPDFGALANLQHLDLLNNQLKTLPITFGDLPRLKWLDVKGNPLEPALVEVAGNCLDDTECRQCASDMLVYMKQIQMEIRKKQMESARKHQVKAAAREALKQSKLKAEKLMEKEKRRQEYETKKAESLKEKALRKTMRENELKNGSNNLNSSEKASKKSSDSNSPKSKSQRATRKTNNNNNNNNNITNKKKGNRTKTWCGLFAVLLAFAMVIIAVIVGRNVGMDSNKLLLQIQQKAEHIITAAKKMTKI